MKDNKWLHRLAYVTGLVNQQLLLQNEYLAAENQILRAHLPARLHLCDAERSALAEIGKRSDARRWYRQPAWPSQTQSWPGTGG